MIDPDGEGGLTPYHVTCDRSDKDGVGVTVIGHDSENRTLVDGCEDPGCYSRDIHYTGATFSQLASVTRVSLFCEQFIKYECLGLIFHDRQNQTRNWWVSRDSMNMAYLGGSSRMKGTCAKRGDRCNCDKNDLKWRGESGLVTEKKHLPVKQLRFGDVDVHKRFHEVGYHTL